MTRFSNKFKKPFGPFLGHIPHFLGKKIFFKKPGSVTHKTHGKFQKKRMSQSQENFQIEGQKDGRTDRP